MVGGERPRPDTAWCRNACNAVSFLAESDQPEPHSKVVRVAVVGAVGAVEAVGEVLW